MTRVQIAAGAVFALSACGASSPEIAPAAPAAPQEEALMPDLMSWPDLTGQPLPSASTSVRTGPLDTDVVDVWLPEGEGPHPTVLMVHGGCWQKAIADRTLMNYAAAALRDEGMAVWNIEYRGVDEAGGGYPGTYQDVARAVDALGAYGPALGLEVSNVVAIGHSAGGHLALWAAARPKLPETSPLYEADPLAIKGVVNVGGLADLEASAPVTQAGCLADIMNKLTGLPIGERANVFADTSPAEMLPLGVRQVSLNGANDKIAPPVLGKAYSEKAGAAGDPAVYVEIPRTGHVELVAPGTAAFDAEIAILQDMLGMSDE